jgi:excisionase family DNA binding protein
MPFHLKPGTILCDTAAASAALLETQLPELMALPPAERFRRLHGHLCPPYWHTGTTCARRAERTRSRSDSSYRGLTHAIGQPVPHLREGGGLPADHHRRDRTMTPANVKEENKDHVQRCVTSTGPPTPVLLAAQGDQPARIGSGGSPYLTAVEAAAYLRTTRGTVYNLVWRGVLPRRRGKLLFTKHELDAYLSGNQQVNRGRSLRRLG